MSKYKLSEDDVEFWAESYGAYSKAVSDAIEIAMGTFIKSMAWAREATEDQWLSAAPERCRTTVSIILEAGAIAAKYAAKNAQIEETISGGRKGKVLLNNVERIKQRAVVLQVLKDIGTLNDKK